MSLRKASQRPTGRSPTRSPAQGRRAARPEPARQVPAASRAPATPAAGQLRLPTRFGSLRGNSISVSKWATGLEKASSL